MSSDPRPKMPRPNCLLAGPFLLAVIMFGQFQGALKSCAATLSAQTSTPTPTHLAIINEDSSTAEVERLLTVELSKRPELTLLERQQIARVLGEQELSATTRDYLKLGQTIGADGLLVLTPATENTNKSLQARLIAVRTGVVIGETRSPWIWSQPKTSIKPIVTHFERLFEKLTVSAQDAVPISVLNLHSAFLSTDSETLERELTALLIDRLAQERELFVLERQHLGEVVSEQDFKRTNDSSFWTGQYVINGTVDPEGLSPGRLAIKASLASARNGRPVTISVAGLRENPPAVIQALTEEILKALHVQQRTSDWNSLAEAERFSEEAKWAYEWGIYREAQQASESAWALGCRTRALTVLRIRSYLADHWLNPWNIQRYPEPYPRGPWGEVGFNSRRHPNPDKLKTANRAVELYNQQCRSTSAKAWQWITLATQRGAALTAGKILSIESRMSPAELKAAKESLPSLVGELNRIESFLIGVTDSKTP